MPPEYIEANEQNRSNPSQNGLDAPQQNDSSTDSVDVRTAFLNDASEQPFNSVNSSDSQGSDSNFVSVADSDSKVDSNPLDSQNALEGNQSGIELPEVTLVSKKIAEKIAQKVGEVKLPGVTIEASEDKNDGVEPLATEADQPKIVPALGIVDSTSEKKEKPAEKHEEPKQDKGASKKIDEQPRVEASSSRAKEPVDGTEKKESTSEKPKSKFGDDFDQVDQTDVDSASNDNLFITKAEETLLKKLGADEKQVTQLTNRDELAQVSFGLANSIELNQAAFNTFLSKADKPTLASEQSQNNTGSDNEGVSASKAVLAESAERDIAEIDVDKSNEVNESNDLSIKEEDSSKPEVSKFGSDLSVVNTVDTPVVANENGFVTREEEKLLQKQGADEKVVVEALTRDEFAQTSFGLASSNELNNTPFNSTVELDTAPVVAVHQPQQAKAIEIADNNVAGNGSDDADSTDVKVNVEATDKAPVVNEGGDKGLAKFGSDLTTINVIDTPEVANENQYVTKPEIKIAKKLGIEEKPFVELGNRESMAQTAFGLASSVELSKATFNAPLKLEEPPKLAKHQPNPHLSGSDSDTTAVPVSTEANVGPDSDALANAGAADKPVEINEGVEKSDSGIAKFGSDLETIVVQDTASANGARENDDAYVTKPETKVAKKIGMGEDEFKALKTRDAMAETAFGVADSTELAAATFNTPLQLDKPAVVAKHEPNPGLSGDGQDKPAIPVSTEVNSGSDVLANAGAKDKSIEINEGAEKGIAKFGNDLETIVVQDTANANGSRDNDDAYVTKPETKVAKKIGMGEDEFKALKTRDAMAETAFGVADSTELAAATFNAPLQLDKPAAVAKHEPNPGLSDAARNKAPVSDSATIARSEDKSPVSNDGSASGLAQLGNDLANVDVHEMPTAVGRDNFVTKEEEKVLIAKHGHEEKADKRVVDSIVHGISDRDEYAQNAFAQTDADALNNSRLNAPVRLEQPEEVAEYKPNPHSPVDRGSVLGNDLASVDVNYSHTTDANDKQFVTKPEVAQAKKIGVPKQEFLDIDTRDSMAPTFGMANSEELNRSTLNASLGLDRPPVVAEYKPNPVQTKDLSGSRSLADALVETAPSRDSVPQGDRAVVKGTEKFDSDFAQLTINDMPAVSNDGAFVTKPEVALLKKISAPESEVVKAINRDELAQTSFGLQSASQLNDAPFNTAVLRDKPAVVANTSAESRDVEALDHSPVDNNPIAVAAIANQIAKVEASSNDNVNISINRNQQGTNGISNNEVSGLTVNAKQAKVRVQDSSAILPAESGKSSLIAKMDMDNTQVKQKSAGATFQIGTLGNTSITVNAAQSRSASIQNNIATLARSTAQTNDVSTLNISKSDAEVVNASSTLKFDASRSSIDTVSAKRSIETTVAGDSARSAVSHAGGKGQFSAIAKGNMNIVSDTVKANLASGEITVVKTNFNPSTNLNTITGSIIDSSSANASSIKISGLVKGLGVAAATNSVQGEAKAFDVKIASIGFAHAEGQRISISNNFSGKSSGSIVDLSNGTAKADGKTVSINLDGTISIIKGNGLNGVKSINITIGQNTLVGAKSDLSSTGSKSDATTVTTKTDTTIKTETDSIVSVKETIKSAKTIINGNTAPALIAAVKNGGPLPAGMTIENGYIKFIHNGQVLYFPGLKAALKFVEGLGIEIDFDDEDDEEWYVQTLDAKGNSKRVQYIVVPGDTVESISEQRLGDARFAGLLVTINRTEIVYRLVNGVKVPFVYPSQVIWLPSRYECKVYRKNYFSKSNAHQSGKNNSVSHQVSAEATRSIPNGPSETPNEVLEKLHAEVVDYYKPKSVSKESVNLGYFGPDSGPLARMIDQVRFAGKRESVNLDECSESVGRLSQKVFHEVSEGDTLISIALRNPQMGDTRFWKLIAQINGLTTQLDRNGLPCETLVPGQFLLIPSTDQIKDFCEAEAIPYTPKLKTCSRVPLLDAGDTVITSEAEVVKFSDYCRLTEVKMSDQANGYSIYLQFNEDGEWKTIASYQKQAGRMIRTTFSKNGVTSSIVIDLPMQVVREMAYEEFKLSWQQRCNAYSDGAVFDAKNGISNVQENNFIVVL